MGVPAMIAPPRDQTQRCAGCGSAGHLPTLVFDQRTRPPGVVLVLSIRSLGGTSSVKAFVDVQLGGVKIMGAKIVQQPDKRAWVAMPSVKSERAWNNVVELSKPLRERVTEEVLRCWATHQPPQDPLARVFDAGPPDYPLHDGQHNTSNESCPFDDDIPF
jgi:DNA-binding cell septation regulator SpoVG